MGGLLADRDQLLEAFDRGALVRPSSDQMRFVDVVRALAHECGVEVPLNRHSAELAERVHGADHIVFIVADGLGIDLVERMPRTSWLREHTVSAIQASFPSTTTSAITSLSTAQHPSEHGVVGWWVHLEELQAPATVFAHDRAEDGKSLRDLGLGVDAIYPTPPMMPRMKRDAAIVVPAGIVDSPFTVHMAGSVARLAYRTYGEAVTTIVNRIAESSGPTFTYWYTPSPDTESHDEGTHGERVSHAVGQLDRTLAALSEALDGLGVSWRIVGTADHGHLELDPRLEVQEGDPIMQHLRCAPSGDMRVQFWHVRDERTEAFASAFRQKYGTWFYLLTSAEAEELELFGPRPWSPLMRTRAGSFVSISKGRAALRFAGIPGSAGYRRMRSGHSGLSPAEMRVPLMVAGDGLEASRG